MFDTKPTTVDVILWPDLQNTQAWLDEYGPRLRIAVKGTDLHLERRKSLMVVVTLAGSSFKVTYQDLFLPAMLCPPTCFAKVARGGLKAAVLILSHADTTGATAASTCLGLDYAKSVVAILCAVFKIIAWPYVVWIQSCRLGLTTAMKIVHRAVGLKF